MRRFLLVVCVVVVLQAETKALSAGGHLVLNGGGSKPAEVMLKFVELSGGKHAPIVVFPTASGEPDTGEYYRDLLANEYGCTNLTIAPVKTKDDAGDFSLAERVRSAGGIFFSGGDQRRIIAALHDTLIGKAIHEAFERGAVVGGTSAGTACQSPLMVTGEGDFTVISADNVELVQGLGLFEGVIVDQHFVARQRQNRLFSAVLEHPELLGVGIDEATAVWVRPDGIFTVLGEGWVMVFDAGGARIIHQEAAVGQTILGVHGLVTHILLPGDQFNLETREVIAGTEGQ